LPPGQTIDIPYLKKLETCVLVPIVYCPQRDIDHVTLFKPAYLARVTKNFWELYDDQFYNIDKLYWDQGNGSLLNRFGTSIQHPKDHFVQYFGGTKPTLIEKGSHVVHQGKILQKPTILMEEDCLVLYLPDVEERICQVKEEPRRSTIEAKRVREGWT
jgi:hypothetical protein